MLHSVERGGRGYQRPARQDWDGTGSQRSVGLWEGMARPDVFVKDVCAYTGPREGG